MNTATFLKYSLLLGLAFSSTAQNKIDKDPDVTPLEPQASQQSIRMEAPFKADLIAAEPMVNEPIVMAWGGDGALYVVELRGYMQDADHSGAQEPVGQVVRLEDSNGDGIMDKQSVFVDKLVEPRAIMAVKGGLLIAAPPNIYFCKDSTGDGVADIRKSVYDRYAGRGGNVEHKDNGLMWGIDNWIYNAKSATRYQYIQDDKGGKFLEGQTGFRGQWGITQDNIGHIYATGNTTPWIGEQIAYEYLMHNKLVHDDTFSQQKRLEKDFKKVWPIIGTPDVQGGPGAIRKEDNTLHSFTAIGGQAIFRGDKLGEDMVGQYFIPEPVGRLVRRAVIEEKDGFRTLTNPLKDQQKEFMASTDSNFRPVNAFTGPDGCLYIIDMYRGIIQDGNWTRPGSYLRKEILRRGLDKNIQRGRIYRISKDGIKPGAIPKFDSFSNDQLIKALAHPNGWWRDEAQKRLVLAQDKSVVPALKNMLKAEKSALGRVHAIWTLRGLDSWDKASAESAIKDSDWQVQFTAIRASEKIIQEDSSFIKTLAQTQLINDKVARQVILSLGLCNSVKGVKEENKAAARSLITKIAMTYPKNELMVLSTVASMPGQEEALLASILKKSGDPQEASAWLKMLGRIIIKSGDAKRVEKLLQMSIASSQEHQKILIQGLAEALPQNGRGSGSRVTLVRFDKKPQVLSQLEETHAGSEQLKKSMTWFTWPGEARYDKPYAVVEMTHWEKDLYNRGKTIYNGLCAACHGQDGMGIKIPGSTDLLAPALAANKRVEADPDKVVQILLHGLTGPIDGKKYSGLMAAMGSNDDEWIGSVTTYIRRAWGNVGESVPHHQVKRVRARYKDRKTPWTDAELKKK